MNQRENLLSLLGRKGYDRIFPEFRLCPPLAEEFTRRTGSALDYEEFFEMPWRYVQDGIPSASSQSDFRKYYDFELMPGTTVDCWGVAHEPDSARSPHLSFMLHPLRGAQDPEEIEAYPFPDFGTADFSRQKSQADRIHGRGLAAVGSMQKTIWETAWYLRGMEELMIDMMDGDPKALILLDKVTERALLRAEAFARAGVDILYLGDDVGTQKALLMSEDLYATWLKPRLAKVIRAAKAINPDLLVFYHSCGYVTPLIPHLIEAGIDVLNPIQSECMDFKEIRAQYGDRISFHGTIGTQTVMPFGSPEEVRRETTKNLEIAGERGGLMVAPTHTLTADVPWENILAYVQACRDFK